MMMKKKKKKKKKQNNSNIDGLLSSLIGDSTSIVANAEVIEDLKKRGLILDKQENKSNAQVIEELFAARKKIATNIADKFPQPPSIAIPTLNSLYAEIRECILFGLNGAAISLSAILVEYALKHAIVNHIKGQHIYDKEEWNRLENKELGPVIKEAFDLGIIGEEERKNLDRFRKETRNPYLHYNIKKITAGIGMKGAKRVHIDTGVVEEVDLNTEDNPIIWQSAKKFVDNRNVMDVFGFADSVVKHLFVKK